MNPESNDNFLRVPYNYMLKYLVVSKKMSTFAP